MVALVRSVVTITTAPAGTGKSYVRAAHFISQEFLPETNGLHISNFHLHKEAVAAEAARVSGKPLEELVERLVVLPQTTLATWESGESGPWATFEGWDLSGAHIAIDEIHLYCGAHARRSVIDKWMKWLGGIRHAGATVELISQDPTKMAKELEREAAVRLSLVGADLMRDPWAKIPFADWYELRAKLKGEYRSAVWQLEKRKHDGRWVQQDARKFWLESRLFALYDSYNQLAGTSQAGQPEGRPWCTLTWPQLVRWFVRRNLWGLGRVAFMVTVVFLMVFTPAPRKAVSLISDTCTQAFSGGSKANAPQPNAVQKASTEGAMEDLMTHVDALQAENLKNAREIAELQNELGSRAVELERVRMENDLLRKQSAAASALAAIAPDRIVLRGGREYGFGELITEGEWNGRRLVTIDFGRRLASLDDGTVLRLGVGGGDGMLERVKGTAAAVPGAIRGVTGIGQGEPTSSTGGTNGNVVGSPATAGRNTPTTGEPTPAKRRR